MAGIRNESTIDRVIRAVAGIALAALGYTLHAGIVVAVVLYALGAVLVVTALTGFCPLYALFRVRTDGDHKTRAPRHAS